MTISDYIDSDIEGYTLKNIIGSGKIGTVFRAERSGPISDTLACKIIPGDSLKTGWEKEVEKVIKLRRVPNVVQYHHHSVILNKKNQPDVYVFLDYIEGVNLKTYIENNQQHIDLSFVEEVIHIILKVLHACYSVGIFHGDLHEGNILVADPDPRMIGAPQTILISDFGFGGSHNRLEPKDDFRQLHSIGKNLLKHIKPSDCTSRDKIMYNQLKVFLEKTVIENDKTQGKLIGSPELLLKELKDLSLKAEAESALASNQKLFLNPGDYLMAESLGYRAEEWKNLFVPEFLASRRLLERTTTVLTGARGCGKTMVFRRMTAFMDIVIGEPSKVKGADSFIGFYLNCRDLAEAFPWLPKTIRTGLKEQILHFFNLAWFSEILKTIGIYDPERESDYEWLNKFVQNIFGEKYLKLPQGIKIISHIRAFIDDEKEYCRLVDIGTKSGLSSWPLARIDFIPLLHDQLRANIAWMKSKPIYLFLDDYTIPIIPREAQKILNPIIFNRKSQLFFKISTEATNSFDRTGVNGKILELVHDFELIDLANESIKKPLAEKAEILNKIFKPRINRIESLSGNNYGLKDILGSTPMSGNALARLMRSKPTTKVQYSGEASFVGMWSSDIRIMIEMFTAIIKSAHEKIEKGNLPVIAKVQNEVFRTQGGEFIQFIGSSAPPSITDKGNSSAKPNQKYGSHLKDIVEAFVKVSRFEMTKGPLIKNEGKKNPKQAFRLEIVDKFEIDDDAEDYYEGLKRWHIFLQDWRGKSVRGMITPRLFLNRVLLPYCALTYSGHDNIGMSNKEFNDLLINPTNFYNYWVTKRRKRWQAIKKRQNKHYEQREINFPTKGK